MRFLSVILFATALVILSPGSNAAEPVVKEDILAQRGKGIVTQQSFTARADKIPSDIRLATLRDRNRLEDVIVTLLLRAQIAADAREAGFDKEEVINERMRLAAEAELAEAWVQKYVEMQPAADYEAMALEFYQLNQERMLTPDNVSVTHILVSTENRSDDEAKELADSIQRQVDDNPAIFDELVLQYSEDPSAAANKGKFTNIKKGQMVKPFEDVAFSLAEGEISDPVKTQYGYHVIRLDAHPPRTPMKFENVKERLVSDARKQHEERIKKDYIESLTSLDVKMSEAALEEMVRRLFGENNPNPQLEGAE